MLCNFIVIALRHRCSPVNLLHIFRTPFLNNTCEGLLLSINDMISTLLFLALNKPSPFSGKYNTICVGSNMQAMDNHRKGLNEKSEKKEEPVSLEGIIRLIKKFVMLLGQASIFFKLEYFKYAIIFEIWGYRYIESLCVTVINRQYETFWLSIPQTRAR